MLDTDNRVITKQFIILFFANFCFFTSYACLAMMPVQLENLHASNTYTGFFMNIQAVELILFVFFEKRLRYFRKKELLAAGFVISIVSMLFMSLFCNSLVLLLIFRIISSTSYAFGYTLLFGMIYDIIPPSRRKGGAALYGISGIIANPAGSFISEYFYKSGHVQLIFIMSAVFSFSAIILLFFIHDRSPVLTGDECSLNMIDVLRDSRIFLLIFFSFIFGGVYGVLTSFIPTFSKLRIHNPNISYFFTAFTVGAVPLRLFSFNLLDRISSRLLIFVSFISMLVSLVLTLFLNSAWILFLVGFTYGFGHTILFPSLSASFVNISDEKNKLTYNNAFIAANLFGTIAISTLLGMFGDFFGITSIFLIMGFLVVAAVIFILLFKKRIPEHINY